MVQDCLFVFFLVGFFSLYKVEGLVPVFVSQGNPQIA